MISQDNQPIKIANIQITKKCNQDNLHNSTSKDPMFPHLTEISHLRLSSIIGNHLKGSLIGNQTETPTGKATTWRTQEDNIISRWETVENPFLSKISLVKRVATFSKVWQRIIGEVITGHLTYMRAILKTNILGHPCRKRREFQKQLGPAGNDIPHISLFKINGYRIMKKHLIFNLRKWLKKLTALTRWSWLEIQE